MTPFEAIAPQYNELWSEAPRGREQREAVWREIDGLFREGDKVLDLGCGTGDDAVHLAQFGVQVIGIDSAPKMVEIARTRGVDARLVNIPVEGAVEAFQAGEFFGAISNFGALNCVSDLRPVAESLSRWVRSQGPVAICVMGRFSLADLKHALPRLRGKTQWRGMSIYYSSARRVRGAFAPWFDFERRVSIGHGDHHLYIFRRRR